MARRISIFSWAVACLWAMPSLSAAQELDPAKTCPDGMHLERGEDLMVDGLRLRVAAVEGGEDGSGGQVLNLRLDTQSTAAFGEFSAARVGEQVDLSIGDEVIMSPFIYSPVLGGVLQISGAYGSAQLEALAERLVPGCTEKAQPLPQEQP